MPGTTREAQAARPAWEVQAARPAQQPPATRLAQKALSAQTYVPRVGSSAAGSKAGSPGRDTNAADRAAAASSASSIEISCVAKGKSHRRAAKIRAARARLQAQQARSNESVKDSKKAEEAAEVAAATKKGGSSRGGAAEARASPVVDDRATGPGNGESEAATKQTDVPVNSASGRAAAKESGGEEFTQVDDDKPAPAQKSRDRVGRRCGSGAATPGEKRTGAEEDCGVRGADHEGGTGAGSDSGAPPATTADQWRRRHREMRRRRRYTGDREAGRDEDRGARGEGQEGVSGAGSAPGAPPAATAACGA